MFHLNTRIYSRSHGHSSVAHSAYCSRSSMYDRRRGVVYDYSYKCDLDLSFVHAPEISPSWIYDRNALWNEVERLEKRPDSQLFRGITLAFPKVFRKDIAGDVLLRFVDSEFVSEGMVVDSNIHGVGGGNPHAHLMITLRSISKDGFGLKNRKWNALGNVTKWRQSWAEACNCQLDKMGLSHLHISPLSHAARGICKNPQVHAGHSGMKKLMDGEIDEYNAQIEIDRLRKEMDRCQSEIDLIFAKQRRRMRTSPRIIVMGVNNKVDVSNSDTIHQSESQADTAVSMKPAEISVSGIADRLKKVSQNIELPESSRGHDMAP